MARGVERCVMPKTTEAKVAKSSTAVKWDGVNTQAFLPM